MSCYEWERGEILLPSDQATRFKQQFRTFAGRYRNEMKAQAIVFWEQYAKKTRSSAIYRERLHQWLQKQSHMDDYLLDNLLWSLAEHPRKVQEKDLDYHLYPKPTNRINRFEFADASITFDGRKVIWDVYENNRACEHAHAHPLGRKLFELFGQVKWTRGSGGKIIGNDEYNRDSDYEGGGGNYVKYETPKPKQQKRTSTARW